MVNRTSISSTLTLSPTLFRRYYPDFLMQKDDGSWVIVEVKRDDVIDTRIVQAKAEYTRQIANASRMSYKIIPGSEGGGRTVSVVVRVGYMTVFL